ncbi:MAG: tripartite tricarboxylate transporter substrate-binding protein, partial [Deltaproteobacteria bacterium]|nr:tripartite tricarboxylate transporter substrate-binding protein [Deltaproteobacteria bacterium]
SGDLRNLVIFGPKRDPGYPDMPTIKEKGLEHYGGSWAVFAGPKGLPPAIAQKLTKAIKDACQDGVRSRRSSRRSAGSMITVRRRNA